MSHSNFLRIFLGALLPVCLSGPRPLPDEPAIPKSAGAESKSADVAVHAGTGRHRDIKALQPLSVLVGKWRVVGQPQRGSNTGAWSEELTAAWSFADDQANLVVSSSAGKQFQSMTFATDPETQNLTVQLVLPDERRQILTQVVSKSTTEGFVFCSPEGESPALRCTVRRISDIRVTMLFEQRTSATGSFRRVAEIGCTRAGEKLARGNAGERQCIVTGGLGTISVSHAGMTFYVCCEGCRQAFDEDPEGTIAAYRERLRSVK